MKHKIEINKLRNVKGVGDKTVERVREYLYKNKDDNKDLNKKEVKKKDKIEYNTVILGDCLDVLRSFPDKCIDMCVTSPPYWRKRDYGVEGQIGLEEDYKDYVNKLDEIFIEVRRVMKDKGTLWLNLGDSYCASAPGKKESWDTSGLHGSDSIKYQETLNDSIQKVKEKRFSDLKDKDLIGIPWRVAFSLQNSGWYLRNDIIWSKKDPMPESVKDRATVSHEYMFLFSKRKRYYFNFDEFKERAKGENYEFRNRRTVWEVSTDYYDDAHFAVFPEDLIEPCILTGSREGDVVLDPFFGRGTTGYVALKNNRKYIGIELSKDIINMSEKWIKNKMDKLNRKV